MCLSKRGAKTFRFHVLRYGHEDMAEIALVLEKILAKAQGQRRCHLNFNRLYFLDQSVSRRRETNLRVMTFGEAHLQTSEDRSSRLPAQKIRIPLGSCGADPAPRAAAVIVQLLANPTRESYLLE